MSKSTRRLVFFTCLVVALTVPAEILLLRALAVPDRKQAIRDWAESLSASQLSAEVGRIQAYPVLYRKELLRSSTPDVRSQVWRAHFDAYLESRPGLDVNSASLVRSLREMLTPAFFDSPQQDRREDVMALADQVAAAIGLEDALPLMEYLGPADGAFASYEPTAMYLANKLRSLFVANAQGWTCDCTMDAGCYSPASSCSYSMGCAEYTGWPACGWTWSDPCTGLCVAGWGRP